VLPPGATAVARPIASARDRAAARLYRTPAEAATGEPRRSLEELLDVAVYGISRLEVLRAGPRKLTASEVAEAFGRPAAVRKVGARTVTVDVRTGRMRALGPDRRSAREAVLHQAPDRTTSARSR